MPYVFNLTLGFILAMSLHLVALQSYTIYDFHHNCDPVLHSGSAPFSQFCHFEGMPAIAM
jgi:hypothetical protein